jgi:hypothetical protein
MKLVTVLNKLERLLLSVTNILTDKAGAYSSGKPNGQAPSLAHKHENRADSDKRYNLLRTGTNTKDFLRPNSKVIIIS